jgi:transcription initiation factor IIE alpha subunit
MESVTLTSKEQTRVAVLNEVTQGDLTATEAAGLLGVSVRQIRRILTGALG